MNTAPARLGPTYPVASLRLELSSCLFHITSQPPELGVSGIPSQKGVWTDSHNPWYHTFQQKSFPVPSARPTVGAQETFFRVRGLFGDNQGTGHPRASH